MKTNITNKSPETPAVGIMKLHEYPDAVWYDVACDCGSKDHFHSIWIMKDSKTGLVEVNISTESTTDFWSKNLEYDYDDRFYWIKSVVDEIITRSKLIWKILIHGYVKRESYVLLNQQQAVNYANALLESVKSMTQENEKNETTSLG